MSSILQATTTTQIPVTRIVKGAPYLIEINFFHTDAENQVRMLHEIVEASKRMAEQPGQVAVNTLRSLDGSRVCTYLQWDNQPTLRQAHRVIAESGYQERALTYALNQPLPRVYEIVYTDDRSSDGVSVISPAYEGAIFINEITTQPLTQARLLQLVIANNEIQSMGTSGYRSANFHRSLDGERAVNYSLWDTSEHCIEAISNMADMDENLEETVQIANPDFRFYELVFAVHR